MMRRNIKIPFSQALEKYLTAREEAFATDGVSWAEHRAALDDMQEAADHMDALTSNTEDSK